MNKDVARLSISEAVTLLRNKEVSSLDIVRACKSHIDAGNETLNVYLEVFDDIESQAQRADNDRSQGSDGPLLGIPMALKDNILIEGRHASAASKILSNYVATYDATVTRKIKTAGAVLMGRTNMDEFAMGSSTENSAFGPTKNPIDPGRVPGGSSGGSAAAVASGMALGALGTDTGGSVREPASFCGLVGLKPTYGAVSRSGLIAMGSSLDQAGPLTRTVADSKLLFDVMRGKDALDSTSIHSDFYPKRKHINKIGVPYELLEKGIDIDVRQNFDAMLASLKDQGYEVVPISLPSASLALAIYYVIMPAEVSTNLARFDGVRYGLSLKGDSLADDYAKTRIEGFSDEVRRRIMLGTYVLSSGYYDAYFGKATQARNKLTSEFARVLEEVDVVATPTAPTPAVRLGEKSDPLSMYLLDIFTVTANITGNPALSIPMGNVLRDGTELPTGIQFTSAHGDEDFLFTVGQSVERAMTHK